VSTRTAIAKEAAPTARVADVCATCAARVVGLCAPLDAVALGQIAGGSERIAVRARDVIFLQGDPSAQVFALVSGAARLTRLLPDGRRAAIGFRFAGDLIGYTPAAEYPFGAEALGDATLCRMDRGHLDLVLRTNPAIERSLLDLCARELAATQDQVMALARFTAEERVATFLVALAGAHAARGRIGRVLDLPGTRADLGDLLGLTLETVSRVISAFRRRGWIALHAQSGVELIEPQQLRALARGEGACVGGCTAPA
jgi:CRP/FNR family transcriptional regulator